MKTILLSISVLLMAGTASATNYKLAEALQKKLVKVNITGAKPDTSIHISYPDRAPSMSLELISASAEALNIDVEYGYKLVPADSNIQTMMVSQTLFVKLQPKQKKSYRLYAMCTEAHDGGPSASMDFELGKRAAGSLLNLAELINRKKYQSDAAQNAVWCLTNDYDFRSINSGDTTMMYELRRFIAKVKGISLDKIYTMEPSGNTVATPPVYTRHTTYSGVLNYSMGKDARVLIALFDEDNNMKKVYVNNEVKHRGDYTVSYELKSEDMNGKRHYLRMYRDGRLTEEISIIPD